MNRSGKLEPGQPLSANNWNALRKQTEEGTSATGAIVKRIGGSTAIQAQPQNGARSGGATVIFAKIITIEDDYLTCYIWNPATSTGVGSINVAKPYMLQQTPFDGETIEYDNGDEVEYNYDSQRQRVATIGSDDETQVMTPNYFVGEIIRAVSGNTGITVSSDPVLWEDLNTCGRFWAAS